ncbi:hypothetical protein AVEN_104118-1 [Araneus ventricosus]|uniref:Uncharacterized protein n=1 Tax=Araneus ventricosus TaxID=182803 RepID=A0A4Y2JBC4_ARAVE|nr:hypothetical protein AVEN_104118-1 [Araneus ventricosus]
MKAAEMREGLPVVGWRPKGKKGAEARSEQGVKRIEAHGKSSGSSDQHFTCGDRFRYDATEHEDCEERPEEDPPSALETLQVLRIF